MPIFANRASSTSGCPDMRLIQLDPNGSDESALDLHPMITVITGVDQAARQRIVDSVSALPRGADPGMRGLVEAFGIMLDLTPEVLAMLDLHSDLDVVVRASDVPPAQAGSASPAGATVRVSVEQFLADAPEGRHAELDVARKGQEDARVALEIFRDSASRASDDLSVVTSRRQRAEAALGALRDQEEAAESHLGSDDDVTPELDEVEVGARRLALESDAADLQATVSQIDVALSELAAIDTRPIHVLLDAIKEPVEIEWVESDRAQALADELVAVQAQMAAVEAHLEAEGRGPSAAMTRLEAARANLQAAERAMTKPQLSPDDIAELEAAHDGLLEAESKLSGFMKKGGQKRLDEAAARQQAVLDRVGFPTWSAYVMGAGLMAIDPMAEAKLEQARFDLEAAETNWANVSGMLETDPEYGALIDRLETILVEARDLLDGAEPEDLDRALRELRVPRREVSAEDLSDALAYQLELIGLSFGGSNPSVQQTVVVAEAFLAETAGIEDRIEELKAQRSDVTSRLAAAEGELMALAVSHPEPTIDLTDGAEVAGFPDDPAGFADPVESEPVFVDRAALEAELAQALEDEQEALEMFEAREALLDTAMRSEAVASSRLIRVASDLAERSSEARPESEPAFEVAPGDSDGQAGPEAIEFYLLARLAAQRHLSFAGSVPLVVDDALVAVPPSMVPGLLTKFERMAEAVQIIYLSDDPVVERWASGIGFQMAAVVPVPSGFA